MLGEVLRSRSSLFRKSSPQKLRVASRAETPLAIAAGCGLVLWSYWGSKKIPSQSDDGSLDPLEAVVFVRGDAALCGPFARRRRLALQQYELDKTKVETEDGRLPTAFATCVGAPYLCPASASPSRDKPRALTSALARCLPSYSVPQESAGLRGAGYRMLRTDEKLLLLERMHASWPPEAGGCEVALLCCPCEVECLETPAISSSEAMDSKATYTPLLESIGMRK